MVSYTSFHIKLSEGIQTLTKKADKLLRDLEAHQRFWGQIAKMELNKIETRQPI